MANLCLLKQKNLQQKNNKNDFLFRAKIQAMRSIRKR